MIVRLDRYQGFDNMPRRGQSNFQKYFLIFNLLLGLAVLIYMFSYYTYYEWGQDEDVSWIISPYHVQ